MNDKGEDPFTDEVKKAAEDLKQGAKKAKDIAKEELDKIDFEDEAVRGLKDVESLLTTLTSSVKKKREEWEKKGVEKTVKEDAQSAKETIKETTSELLDDVEDAIKNLKKMLKE